MTGQRSLTLVIWIFGITAIAIFGLGLLGPAPMDAPRIARSFAQSLWYVVPAFFLSRGSDKARIAALVIALCTLGLGLFFIWGFNDAQRGSPASLMGACIIAAFTVAFLFSVWVLGFYPPLREALRARSAARSAKQEAYLAELERGSGPDGPQVS